MLTLLVLFSGFTILMAGVPHAQADSDPKPEGKTPNNVWLQSPGNPATRVEKQLVSRLAAGEKLGYLIHFKAKPDLSAAYRMDWIERGHYVMDVLQETAARSQRGVKARLRARGVDFQSFWIANVIVVKETDLATLNSLLAHEEIDVIHAMEPQALVEPVEPRGEDETAVPSTTTSGGIEPNLVHIGVPDVWEQGITGDGVVVATIDSGVRFTHRALLQHYRGYNDGRVDHNYNWWDPYNEYDAPVDKNGHGSHVMGIMVGDDGEDNRTGIAPGAEWMACRGCDAFSCGNRELLVCAQFLTAPWDLRGENPNPDSRPHVVNNSWGGCQVEYEPWFQSAVDAWHAAGIYPVFAAGNSSNCQYSKPPGPGTVNNPARYGNVTAVGSTGNDNGEYADHSTWGPTDNGDTVNPRGYADMKPQVVAPGVHIRSASNREDNGYFTLTGTSMSTPHVSGLIALMWQAAPCLMGDYATTETILEETARPISYATNVGREGPGNVPNYATGWGEINAVAAVERARQQCLTVTPPEQSLCRAETADYEIYVGEALSDGEPVTLAASGLPAGATATFSQNPLSPPDRSTLSIEGLDPDSGGRHVIELSGSSSNGEQRASALLNLYVSEPEQPQLLSPDEEAQSQSIQPSFSWSPVTQAESYEFELATDDSFEQIVHRATGIKEASYTMQAALDTGQSYFWRVRARNSCGAGPFSQAQQFATQLGPGVCSPGYETTTVYAEDLESGTSAWTPRSAEGNNEWTLQSRKAQRGTTAWYVPDAASISDQQLISPEIQLPAYAKQLVLKFWHYRNLEADEGGDCNDGGVLEVSTNGGNTWIPVSRSDLLTDSYNGRINYRFENPLVQVSGDESWAWCGNSERWRETIIDVEKYSGQSVRFRLRLGTDKSVRYEGWYVDSLSVEACLPGEGPYFLPVLQRSQGRARE